MAWPAEKEKGGCRGSSGQAEPEILRRTPLNELRIDYLKGGDGLRFGDLRGGNLIGSPRLCLTVMHWELGWGGGGMFGRFSS